MANGPERAQELKPDDYAVFLPGYNQQGEKNGFAGKVLRRKEGRQSRNPSLLVQEVGEKGRVVSLGAGTKIRSLLAQLEKMAATN